LRCNGFGPLDLDVPVTQNVFDFNSRVSQLLMVDSVVGTSVHLTYRDLHLGTVDLHNADGTALICDLVPDRSVLNARLLAADHDAGATRGQATTSSGVQEAKDKEERALRTEVRMLQWESKRLGRELRGMQVLAEALTRQCVSRESVDAAESLAEALVETLSAEELRARSVSLRAENARRLRELSGLEALLHSLKSKDGSAQQREWREPAVQGLVHQMPPDGSCLFHSLAHGLKSLTTGVCSARALRHEVCEFLERRPNSKIAGQLLQDWILWESGKPHDQYAAEMRSERAWGGPIEIAVCSVIKGVQIHVYQEVGNGSFQRICNFDDAGRFSKGIVSVALRPGHYDALEVFNA
jgi:hypothetical protein